MKLIKLNFRISSVQKALRNSYNEFTFRWDLVTRIFLIHLCFDVQQQYIIENVLRVEVDLGISGANLLDGLIFMMWSSVFDRRQSHYNVQLSWNLFACGIWRITFVTKAAALFHKEIIHMKLGYVGEWNVGGWAFINYCSPSLQTTFWTFSNELNIHCYGCVKYFMKKSPYQIHDRYMHVF